MATEIYDELIYRSLDSVHAVLACLLCVMAGIMALRWEIRTEHPHLVRPVWTVKYVEVEQ